MFTKKYYCKPNNKKTIIVSNDLCPSAKEHLVNIGFDIIPTFVNNNVNSFLSKHADMQIVHIRDNTYICAPCCYDYYIQQLKYYSVNLLCGDINLSSNYPGDIAYNIIVTEKYAIHNFRYTDTMLSSLICDKIKINVSQGYTGCTVCKIAPDAFITSDQGIIRKLNEFDVDVLEITSGSIFLNGFDKGFIGGSCFMIDHNLLAVNGNLLLHPDCKRINEFCNSHGVGIVSLSDGIMTDIGSAVVVC